MNVGLYFEDVPTTASNGKGDVQVQTWSVTLSYMISGNAWPKTYLEGNAVQPH